MQGGQAGAQTDAPTRGERGPVYVNDQQAQVELPFQLALSSVCVMFSMPQVVGPPIHPWYLCPCNMLYIHGTAACICILCRVVGVVGWCLLWMLLTDTWAALQCADRGRGDWEARHDGQGEGLCSQDH